VFSYLGQRQAGASSSNAVQPDDSTALELYQVTGKYDPADSSTDRGVTLLHALKWWRKQGQAGTALENYGLAPISTFAAWEPGNLEQLRGTVATLGGMLLGLRMPLTAQNQRVWSVPPGGPQNWGAPGSWQGHCVLAVGYNAECVQCVTWGGIQPLSWQFISTYCDEAFAVFSDTAKLRVWTKQDWTPDSEPNFVERDQVILPATRFSPERNLADAIRKDTAALANVPRWGWEGRIWI
jgi:hypothetical protein